MNKYQEALEKLRKIDQTENTWDENCEVLQELVEKSTPHKLLKNGLCKCGARVLVSFQDYCTQCGQAIDWSEK